MIPFTVTYTCRSNMPVLYTHDIYTFTAVANSPGMLSMRRLIKNKNISSKNTKIILSSIVYHVFKKKS